MIFDPVAKRIILDAATVTAAQIWSRWVDWIASSDNAKYLPALNQVGGDDLGGGLSIPVYIFLLNGWRVRPMESSHQLTITGNLFVEGGGVPVVNTLGDFNVSAQYTVPVQAQAVATGGSGASAADIAAAVRAELAVELAKIHTIEHEAAGARTLNFANGVETLSRTGRTSLARTLYRDAAKTQPVAADTDPVLGTGELG